MIGKVQTGLNKSRAILFDRDIDLYGIPEQEIQSELSKGVVSVKCFTKKRNDLIEPTNTYLLTFGMPTLPTNIQVGLYQMKIDMFVPNPLRCLKCQRFGHGQNTCRGCETCFKCEEGHDGKSCQKDPMCKNRKGDHMSSSMQCPILKKEKEILKVKTEKKFTHPEAKRIVNIYHVPKTNMQSYASALKVTTKDSSTQAHESQILSLTSVNKSVKSSSITVTDTRSTLSKPTSAGSSGVAAPKPAASTSTKSVAANPSTRVERNTRSPQKGNQKHRRDRVSKGANDQVALHSKFGALEDMDFALSPSSTRVRSLFPKKQKGRISPIKHTKHKYLQWNCRGFKVNFNELFLLSPGSFVLTGNTFKITDKINIKNYIMYNNYAQTDRASGGFSIAINNRYFYSQITSSCCNSSFSSQNH